VNRADVIARLQRSALPPETFAETNLPVVPFVASEADVAGEFLGRHRGVLSLGDAACLATARLLGVPAITADRAWAALPLGVEIRLIRG
jgi:PIN domain nuclease of toxin-antitoxin system